MSDLIREGLSKEDLANFNNTILSDRNNPIWSLLGNTDVKLIIWRDRRQGYYGWGEKASYVGFKIRSFGVGKSSGRLRIKLETLGDFSSKGIPNTFLVYFDSFCDAPEKQHSTRCEKWAGDDSKKAIWTFWNSSMNKRVAEIRSEYMKARNAAAMRQGAKMNWEDKVQKSKTSMVSHFGEYWDDFIAWLPEAVTRIDLMMPIEDGAGKEWLQGKLLDWDVNYTPKEADQWGISAEAALNAKALEALKDDEPEVYEKLKTWMVSKYKPKNPDDYSTTQDKQAETYLGPALVQNGNSWSISGVEPVLGLVDKGVLDLKNYI